MLISNVQSQQVSHVKPQIEKEKNKEMELQEQKKISDFKEDKVELSSQSQYASERQTKLEQIKEEIKNGTYKLDTQKIAASIVNELF